MRNCLCCYQPLKEDEKDFHASCAKQLFGTTQPPILDFDAKQLDELAKQIVIKSIAVTGVQPKLSLQLSKQNNESPR